MKIWIRRWFIFTEGGFDAVPYILDLTNENINDDEIAHCIEEQVYKTPLSSIAKVKEKL